MATTKAIVRLVEILAEAYRQKASEGTYAAYEFGLADISDTDAERAVASAIRSCKFMPTVKELRELATGIKDADRPVLAWEAVLAIPFNPYKHVDFDDPLINATIRNLGGWPSFIERFADAEAEKWVRKDFIDTYQRLLSSGVNGDACRPLAGLSEVTCINGNVVPAIPQRVETGLPKLPANFVRPALKTSLRLAGADVPRLRDI